MGMQGQSSGGTNMKGQQQPQGASNMKGQSGGSDMKGGTAGQNGMQTSSQPFSQGGQSILWNQQQGAYPGSGPYMSTPQNGQFNGNMTRQNNQSVANLNSANIFGGK